MKLIQIISRIRPNFGGKDGIITYKSMICEFCKEIFIKKLGLKKPPILLKFCQMISSLYKCINIFEGSDPEGFLELAKDFTLDLLKQNEDEVPFSCIYYIIKFWTNTTFKCVSSNPQFGLNSNSNLRNIAIIFEAYVSYLAKTQEVDGFKSSVQVEEKIAPIPILIKAEPQESLKFMFSNLDVIENLFVQNVLNYKSYLPRNEIDLEESEFWEIDNIK